MMSAIRFDNVSFHYPEEEAIIEYSSIDLEENQVVVLLGANGAGKSTFLKLCFGFLTPSKGTISIQNDLLSQQTSQWIGKKIAYAPQNTNFPYQLNVLDYVLLGRTPFLNRFESPGDGEIEIANQILAELKLEHLVNRTLQDISGGEQQMVSFARIMAQETPIILLDEITSDLDIKNTFKVISILNKLKASHTIVLSTHDPQIAEAVADRIILFGNGKKLQAGSPAEYLTPRHLANLYDIPEEYIKDNPIQIQWKSIK